MYELIGKRISQARRAKGITQEEFAFLCGISVSTISRFESGHTSQPLDNIQKMCDVLNIGLDYALYDILPKNSTSTNPITSEINALLEIMNDSHKQFFLDAMQAYVKHFCKDV